MLVLGEVAVGEQTPGLLAVLFGQETFGQEGGVGGDLVGEGLVDGFYQLGFQGGIVLLLLNHSDLN